MGRDATIGRVGEHFEAPQRAAQHAAIGQRHGLGAVADQRLDLAAVAAAKEFVQRGDIAPAHCRVDGFDLGAQRREFAAHAEQFLMRAVHRAAGGATPGGEQPGQEAGHKSGAGRGSGGHRQMRVVLGHTLSLINPWSLAPAQNPTAGRRLQPVGRPGLERFGAITTLPWSGKIAGRMPP
jgi:hypothetical protein